MKPIDAEDLIEVIHDLPVPQVAEAQQAQTFTEKDKQILRDFSRVGSLHLRLIKNGRPQTKMAVLRLDEWLRRDLPEPDFILGHWLTTTSRVLLSAPTGLGKSMVGMALGLNVASGCGFLHWPGIRPTRVLYIDGEMSRRLLKRRLNDEIARVGEQASGFYAFSHEDADNFASLNTPEGQKFVDGIVASVGGGIDLIIFDNIMSLISGDMKDEESWRQTLPWVRSLTRRNIGQIWIHHTGHDESRSYGTKTREWQMDNTVHLERVERPDTDVSFAWSFRKARERTPETRAEFEDVRIALVDNRWTCEGAGKSGKAKVPPLTEKFFNALRDAVIGESMRVLGCAAATLAGWRNECARQGLLDDDKPDSARSLFSKHKLALIAANWIACNETKAWIIA